MAALPPMHSPSLRVYTVGHSNRPLDEFLAILLAAEIHHLVDVRAKPFSRRHPHFTGPRLRSTCTDSGLRYHWAGRELGGFRPSSPASRHRALPEDLRGYAEHMETTQFQQTIERLMELAGVRFTAIMCAERRPEDCHRRLIADYLTCQGVQVLHLLRVGEAVEHRLSPGARPERGHVVYDLASQQLLPLEF